MPVSTCHPSVEKALKIWKRIEDCISGPDAIRDAGETYLPKMAGNTDDEFKAYAARALFFNASDRTLEAMMGFLFRKPPQDTFPDSLEWLKKDAGCDGVTLDAYARQVMAATSSKGRCGTLVDFSTTEGRPYFAFYRAEDIVNWRVERRAGKQVLSMLILRESVSVPAASDAYALTEVSRYRELTLDAAGICQVRVWQTKNPQAVAVTGATLPTAPGTGAATGDYDEVERMQPLTRRLIPLTMIPFVFHGAQDNSPNVGKAPMADITAVNVSHYQTSADLEHGRHRCATPTAWAVGFGDEDDAPPEAHLDDKGRDYSESRKLYVGTSYAWTSPNTDAKCGYLEFTGAGLQALKDGMEEKQSQMAALGARLVEPRREGVESAEALGLKASAETSTLARIGLLGTESLSEACRLADWWNGAEDEPNDELTYTLNKDFTSSEIPPERIAALVAAHQQGKISWETFFHQMQKGEAYPADWDIQKERDSIDANPVMPPMPPGGMPPPPGGPKPPAKPPAGPPAKPPAKP